MSGNSFLVSVSYLTESRELKDRLSKSLLRRTKTLIADQLPRKGTAALLNVLYLRSCLPSESFCVSVVSVVGFFYVSVVSVVFLCRCAFSSATMGVAVSRCLVSVVVLCYVVSWCSW